MRYVRHPAVEVRPDGDDAVALHLGSGQYFELNASARFVWDRLEHGATVDGVVAEVLDAFRVDEGQARAWVVELLDALVAEGLVIRDGERRRDRWRRRLLGR